MTEKEWKDMTKGGNGVGRGDANEKGQLKRKSRVLTLKVL